MRGRLTGFDDDDPEHPSRRPDREFRGWLWQDGRCIEPAAVPPADDASCLRRSFFSVRLPIAVLREELYANPLMTWPPADLADVKVRLRVLPPGDAAPLFDSDRGGGAAPFHLSELAAQLLAGETLRIRKVGSAARDVISLVGAADPNDRPSRLVDRIIRRLPVEGYDRPLESRQLVATPMGDLELNLTGDVRGVEFGLGPVANRLAVVPPARCWWRSCWRGSRSNSGSSAGSRC